MKKHNTNLIKILTLIFLAVPGLVLLLSGFLAVSPAKAAQVIVTQPVSNPDDNLQLRTFDVITNTPVVTAGTTPGITNSPVGPVPMTTPAIGGPIPPPGYYCIDDVDPDMCDDSSSYLVPQGSGGISGQCGTVINNTHQIVAALPQYDKGLRNSLSRMVATSCASTGPYAAGSYISTYLVIDAYNLTGFHELSKTNPSHVSPTGLFNWWKTPPSGYTFIPYSAPSTMQQFASGVKNLTGCVMFLRTSTSYHIGIVNKLELFNNNGDGVISILQAGTRMYIDRFPVAGWAIKNTSTNQTTTSGVVGFGCHN